MTGAPVRSPPVEGAPAPTRSNAVVAFQVSHQADTGVHGWTEWAIAGDIALRAIAGIDFASVALAWDLSGPLYGSNRYEPSPTNVPSFDREIGFANRHGADDFVSIHINGAAPSGVLAIVSPGDDGSASLGQLLVDEVAACSGLPNLGVRSEHMYSLEAPHNEAAHRVLLELGDNVSDRAFLEDAQGRAALAAGVIAGLERFLDASPSRRIPRFFVYHGAFAERDPSAVLARQGLGPSPDRAWHSGIHRIGFLAPPSRCFSSS
jgi:hypothetical protein